MQIAGEKQQNGMAARDGIGIQDEPYWNTGKSEVLAGMRRRAVPNFFFGAGIYECYLASVKGLS